MPHVLIVGAGPAGASLAHLLAHRGIRVTLLERQRDFAREFRGEVLMPSGIEALEQMGLGQPLAAVPSCAQRSLAAYLNGRPVFSGELDAESFRGHLPRAVSQPGLLEMLVAEAGKSPHFHLERGAAVRDLLVEGDRVVGVRAQTEGGEQLLRADLVVGADGRASVVRKRGGVPARRVDQPMDIVWCKLPCPKDWPGVRLYAGRGHLLIGYHSWDDELQLAWVILKGTFDELRSRGIEQWIKEMARHVSPDFAAHLRTHADGVQKPFLLDVVCDCVERWSAPGMLLIGDAAHTMSPVGGQGINIALRDAIVAANRLVPVLSRPTLDPDQLEAALLGIERERMPEVLQIQAMQADPPRVMLSRRWWGEPVRWILGALLKRSLVQAFVGRRAEAFPFGVTDVRLSV
ncbi:MAG: FAD-dependent oxidoreductase [Planctomycetota bacterium]|jgi:2-polyprenyl-6-methoxyphenol hydroxylase-like FAD-dependent oxidoreductase